MSSSLSRARRAWNHNPGNSKCWWYWREWETCTVGGNAELCRSSEKQCGDFLTTRNRLVISCSNPTAGYITKTLEHSESQRYLHHCSLAKFCNFKWIKYVLYIHKEIYTYSILIFFKHWVWVSYGHPPRHCLHLFQYVLALFSCH